MISQLGSLYIEEHRFEEAHRLLNRAWALFTSAEDAVAMDRIKLLNNRAALHAKQGQWREAGEDLGLCISMVDREAHVDPVAVATLLANHASALRKNHRKREARAIEVKRWHFAPSITDRSGLDHSQALCLFKRALYAPGKHR